MGSVFLSIEMLRAKDGDALWLEYGLDEVNSILIDGGRECAQSAICERIKGLNKPLTLLVLSHIDADHLEGAIRLLSRPTDGLCVDQVWYNGFHHLFSQVDGDSTLRGPAFRATEDDLPRSPLQGEVVSALLCKLGLERVWNLPVMHGPMCIKEGEPLPVFILPGELRLTLLSPSSSSLSNLRALWKKSLNSEHLWPSVGDGFSADLPEIETRIACPNIDNDDAVRGGADVTLDTGIANGSSIAFLAEFHGLSALMLADAHAPQIESSIRQLLHVRKKSRLTVDALKLSHHGSRRNMTPALAQLVDARHVLISTNGAIHGHPDPESINQLIAESRRKMTFHFNYPSACRPELAALITRAGHLVGAAELEGKIFLGDEIPSRRS